MIFEVRLKDQGDEMESIYSSRGKGMTGTHTHIVPDRPLVGAKEKRRKSSNIRVDLFKTKAFILVGRPRA